MTPDPDKVWVLTPEGGLSAEDPDWTDQEGVDTKTFTAGDSISAVVNGRVPSNLTSNLDAYVIADDWTNAAEYVDFSDASLAKVYYDGKDLTDQFTITVDGTKTIATAGSGFLSKTANLSVDTPLKLIITGAFKSDAETYGEEVQITNAGSEQWNNETLDTNEPPVFIRTPHPDKVWVLDENGALTTGDADWTNQQGADNKVFLHGDTVGAVVNGTLAKNLGADLTFYSLTDDWTQAARYVDFADASAAKVFVDGVDRTSDFTIETVGTTTVATAKAGILAGSAGQAQDRIVKLYVTGSFRLVTEATDTNGETIRLTNTGSEKWNGTEHSTNTPPIYAWNPNPGKDVIGSATNGGDQSSINGQMVFPGQVLEYTVTPDLRIPADTAYDIQNFSVLDEYDQQFTVNKESLEVYDTLTNAPVAKTKYTIEWNDESHAFTISFNENWIADRVTSQNGKWLIIRFDGTVDADTAAGSTIANQAWQVLNGSKTPTSRPTVSIPTPEPSKEDLDTSGADIDGKTVMMGDKIVYRLTLDANPARSKLAYDVHKLGMSDDYDEEYLDLQASNVQVVDKESGQDLTAKFNIQVKDGVAYVFAKQVDSTNVNDEEIPGDPQPDDLASYAAASIDPVNQPIIDQALLGHQYWVYLTATVSQETDGHVIDNAALQNMENMISATNTVSNPVTDIDPTKDVVITPGGDSINDQEAALNGLLVYRLNSSIIPANRAYASSQWSIADDYDETSDHLTGQWIVLAQRDLYDGDTLVAKTGDILASSDDCLAGGGTDDEDGTDNGDDTTPDEAQSDDASQSGAEEGDDTGKACSVLSEQAFTAEDADGVFTPHGQRLLPRPGQHSVGPRAGLDRLPADSARAPGRRGEHVHRDLQRG